MTVLSPTVKQINDFEALETKGLTLTYSARYAVLRANGSVSSTQEVWSSGRELSYLEEFSQGNEWEKNILGSPRYPYVFVACGTSTFGQWSCAGDTGGNAWNLVQLQAQPYDVFYEVQNDVFGLADPGSDPNFTEGSARVTSEVVHGLPAVCLSAITNESGRIRTCLTLDGILISFEQAGQPSVSLESLSSTIPSSAFVAPAEVEAMG
jgi:hypothetical protein